MPGFDGDIGTIHLILDFTDGADFLYLVEYELGDDSISDSFGTVNGLAGSVFLLCQEVYETGEPLTFTLYLENVTPTVVTGNFLHETVDIEFVDAAALEAGEARYCFEYQAGPDYCSEPLCDGSPDSLISENQPLICLGQCCGISGKIRLPGIEYVGQSPTFTESTEFDFSEPDFNLIYLHTSFSTKSYYGTFFNHQRFAIPLFSKGDVNEDGSVDLLDVAGFLDCLNSGIYDFQCDMYCSGTVNLLDVAGFVDALSN